MLLSLLSKGIAASPRSRLNSEGKPGSAVLLSLRCPRGFSPGERRAQFQTRHIGTAHQAHTISIAPGKKTYRATMLTHDMFSTLVLDPGTLVESLAKLLLGCFAGVIFLWFGALGLRKA